MKKNYMVSVVDTAKRSATALKLFATTAVAVGVPSCCAFAAGEVSPVGASLLTGDSLTAIQKGFADLGATGAQVVGLAIVAACGIIGLSAGANYAIKKVKGILSKAA